MSASIHSSPLRTPPRPSKRVLELCARIARFVARQALVFASLVATLALGIGSQVYDGPGARFVARDVSAAIYALAWCFGLALMLWRWPPRAVGVGALAVCFAVELSQLWHPHWLEVGRATWPGRLVLGSTFMWSDLAWSVVGVGVGLIWLRCLPFARGSQTAITDDFVRPLGVRPL